jgi:RHS repeat-associated protein
LTNLGNFVVSNNNLTGSIPPLSGLTNLTEFNSGNNQLTGSIPSLDGLTSLKRFIVTSNQLTGIIPLLINLTSLENIGLQDNQLTGPVPASPSSLLAGASSICFNDLVTSGDPTIDAAWVSAQNRTLVDDIDVIWFVVDGNWLTCQALAPKCTLTASPTSISVGGISTITASCIPTATTYTWSVNAGFANSDASGTVSPTATTTYTVSGTNFYGIGNTASVTVIMDTDLKDSTNNPKTNAQASGTDKNALGICPCASSASKDPVDLATGYYYDTFDLMEVAAPGAPLQFNLNYNSGNPVDGTTGFGWRHPYQLSLNDQTTTIKVTWPDSHVSIYTANGDGSYTNTAADAADIMTKNPDNTYTLIDRRQKIYTFDTTGNLTATTDRLGFIRTFTYAGSNLDKVTDALSTRFLQFGYDGANRVTTVTSAAAGTVTLAYNGSGDLASVTDALGHATTFTYDANHRLLTKTNALAATTVVNSYDATTGRVVTQDDGLTTPLERFTYGTDAGTGTTYTDYQNRTGGILRQNFDTKFNPFSIVDPLGGTETNTYDPATAVRTAYTDPLNNQTQFTYDASGYILSRTDAQGRTAGYTYDAEHNILTTTDEAGNVTTMTYGPNHKLLTKTDAKGAVTTYTYNAQGLLATTTAPTGGITGFTYDAQGNLTGKIDPAGITTSYTYDSAGRMLTRTDGGGKVWTMTYDLMGRLLTAADPMGNTTTYTYDTVGRMATKTAPGGGIIIYAYDIHDNLTSLTDPLGGVSTFDYDADDQLISSADPLGHTTYFTRDAKGRITATTNPMGNITSKDYNAADAVTGTTDALNKLTGFAYDTLRRLTTVTDPLNKTTTLAYNNVSKVTSRTDAKGNATSFGYDALGQLVSSATTLGGTARQAFDLNGNRASFTDNNGNVTTITLDTANRITRIATADGGATNYTYNSRNLVTTATNGRGQVATYSYNNAGRLITLADPAGTITYSYDANGNILTLVDSRGTASYSYDLLNRITSYTDIFGKIIAYGYDAAHNLTSLTYPGSKTVTYTYDAANRMTSVTDWSGHVTAYSYDANSNLTMTTRANGTKAAYSYDAKEQVTSITETTVGNASLYTIAYTYDANGNITSETTTPADPAIDITAGTMTYGADNRLSSAYGQPVVYDTDGNMTSGPLNGATATYTFDARNRLTGIGTSSYVYDAQGNRVSTTNGAVTTRYVVDPNAQLPRVLMETTATGTATAYYVYGLGLISREDATSYQTYHYDLRGSTVKLTNAAGVVTDSYQYGPYGELAATTGTTANPFKYNGRDGVMTEANGLYYMRARYYLPEARRFVSRDSLLGSVEQALTLNRFAYVSGNPVWFVDPSGMSLSQTLSKGVEAGGGSVRAGSFTNAPDGYSYTVHTGSAPAGDPRCTGPGNGNSCNYSYAELVPDGGDWSLSNSIKGAIRPKLNEKDPNVIEDICPYDKGYYTNDNGELIFHPRVPKSAGGLGVRG